MLKNEENWSILYVFLPQGRSWTSAPYHGATIVIQLLCVVFGEINIAKYGFIPNDIWLHSYKCIALYGDKSGVNSQQLYI